MQLFIDLLGRFLFGSFALLAAIGFAAMFVAMALAKPANVWQSLLLYVLMDLCLIVVIFLVLAVVKFWSAAKWVDRMLASFTLKAAVVIIGFAVAVMAVGIAKEIVAP